jgi:hypothetical protein
MPMGQPPSRRFWRIIRSLAVLLVCMSALASTAKPDASLLAVISATTPRILASPCRLSSRCAQKPLYKPPCSHLGVITPSKTRTGPNGHRSVQLHAPPSLACSKVRSDGHARPSCSLGLAVCAEP